MHWFKRNWIDKLVSQNKAVHLSFILDDNPALLEENKTELKESYSGQKFLRLIMGEWVGLEEAVYPMFDHELHVTNKIPDGGRYFAAIDYGFNAPTHIGLWNLKDDQYVLVHELIWKTEDHDGQGLTHEAVALQLEKIVKEHTKDHVLSYVVYDPANPALGKVLLKHGFEVQKGYNKVPEGIAKTQQMIEQGLIKIHKSCENFLIEISSYKYKPGTDKVIKENDHAMDAMRYFVMSRVHAQPRQIIGLQKMTERTPEEIKAQEAKKEAERIKNMTKEERQANMTEEEKLCDDVATPTESAYAIRYEFPLFE
jgi:PBSX family phage terminase large subunit